jgi:hypothetical protein
LLYVAEVIECYHHDKGEEWSGLAMGLDAYSLFHFLNCLVIEDEAPSVSLIFACDDVVYTESFFTVLFGLITESDRQDWFVELLQWSDLADDPELVALCRSSVEV